MKNIWHGKENLTQFHIQQKAACRHGMTFEECKFLHPPRWRKYMENPERRCRAQCKGYYLELCKYSMVIWKSHDDRCYKIHIKGTRRKQTPPTTNEPHKNSPNNESTPSYYCCTQTGQQFSLAVRTQHTHCHSPCSINQLITTPNPSLYISPPIILPSHCTPIHHHSMLSISLPTHPPLLPNPVIPLNHRYPHPTQKIQVFLVLRLK